MLYPRQMTSFALPRVRLLQADAPLFGGTFISAATMTDFHLTPEAKRTSLVCRNCLEVSLMRDLCGHVVRTVQLSKGDELFSTALVVEGAFFVVVGSMLYDYMLAAASLIDGRVFENSVDMANWRS